MNVSATSTPSGVNATLMPSGSSSEPNQPLAGEQSGQRDAGHGSRQRERQVDQRIGQPAAGKAIAHQHPRDEEAEHRVDRGRA